MIQHISSNITVYTDDYQTYSWVKDVKANIEKKISSNGICLWEEKLISLEQNQRILILAMLPGQPVPVFDEHYDLKICLLFTEEDISSINAGIYSNLDSVVVVRYKRESVLDAIRNILEPVFFSVLVGLEYTDLQLFFSKGEVCKQITLDLKEDNIENISKQFKKILIENICFTIFSECMLINITGHEEISLYELNMIADAIDDVFPSKYPVYLSANISDRYEKNHLRIDILVGRK